MMSAMWTTCLVATSRLRPVLGPGWTGPTTYIWGRHDFALGRAAAEQTGRFVSGDYRFVEVDAGHWLPETRPQDVADSILETVARASHTH